MTTKNVYILRIKEKLAGINKNETKNKINEQIAIFNSSIVSAAEEFKKRRNE